MTLLEFCRENHKESLAAGAFPAGKADSHIPVTDAPKDARFYKIEHLDWENVLLFWFSVRGSTLKYYAAIGTWS